MAEDRLNALAMDIQKMLNAGVLNYQVLTAKARALDVSDDELLSLVLRLTADTATMPFRQYRRSKWDVVKELEVI